jgi:hypothetical protein
MNVKKNFRWGSKSFSGQIDLFNVTNSNSRHNNRRHAYEHRRRQHEPQQCDDVSQRENRAACISNEVLRLQAHRNAPIRAIGAKGITEAAVVSAAVRGQPASI